MTARTLLASLADRWARQGYPQFVWWIPAVMYVSSTFAFVAAIVQRAGQDAVLPAWGLVAVASLPWLVDALGGRLHWLPTVVLATAPVAVLTVLYPVDYDFALFALVMLAGHLGSLERFIDSAIGVGLMAATFVGLSLTGHLPGVGFWLTTLVIGWDIGFIMRFQQLRIDEQERAASDRQSRAVLAERQRIAREVHDVIAHSLSVTLLHLSAARRSLEDDDVDLAEATDALRDAESTGRQAMADIRQTVGLLGVVAGQVHATPDARDIPALVQQFADAGLQVTLDLTGDPALVTPAVGLGLYRIVQESLANVAKHAPASSARVVVDVRRTRQRVRVWNSLTGPVGAPRPDCAGIRGMQERALQLGGALTAGPADHGWLVELQTPSALRCRLGIPSKGLSTRSLQSLASSATETR
ncbi:sensor histidine kinase [Nocardioides jejuensis]|uniref:histidine kinase n=1 Tax=Nocardioides jejuensis TaxID=2502782 RepID=A0A4R1BZQ0_9ACTN|nr:histidine kinase [Nocardioides jejuensis]TCJ22855.1 two-component sensor histidine kinase [Nocardioides jejuensis]